MNITLGKIMTGVFVLSLILLLIHAYMVSYVVKDSSEWFVFLTGFLLFIVVFISGGIMAYEISEKRF